MNIIIALIFIIYSLNSYSNPIVIISSDIHSEIIHNYVNIAKNDRVVYSIILNDNSDVDIVKERINEIHPNIIFFIGDLSIKRFLTKYYKEYKNYSLAYCCNFESYPDLQIFGINYDINYEKLESIVKKFEHVYILKSDKISSFTIAFQLFKNIKSVPVQLVKIGSVGEVRKFFINIPHNSIVIDLISNLNESYSNEIDTWNKKAIIIGFYDNGVISLIPNYNEITKLFNNYINDNVRINTPSIFEYRLNYYKINNKSTYFKFDIDIFDSVILDTK